MENLGSMDALETAWKAADKNEKARFQERNKAQEDLGAKQEAARAADVDSLKDLSRERDRLTRERDNLLADLKNIGIVDGDVESLRKTLGELDVRLAEESSRAEMLATLKTNLDSDLARVESYMAKPVEQAERKAELEKSLRDLAERMEANDRELDSLPEHFDMRTLEEAFKNEPFDELTRRVRKVDDWLRSWADRMRGIKDEFYVIDGEYWARNAKKFDAELGESIHAAKAEVERIKNEKSMSDMGDWLAMWGGDVCCAAENCPYETARGDLANADQREKIRKSMDAATQRLGALEEHRETAARFREVEKRFMKDLALIRKLKRHEFFGGMLDGNETGTHLLDADDLLAGVQLRRFEAPVLHLDLVFSALNRMRDRKQWSEQKRQLESALKGVSDSEGEIARLRRDAEEIKGRIAEKSRELAEAERILGETRGRREQAAEAIVSVERRERAAAALAKIEKDDCPC